MMAQLKNHDGLKLRSVDRISKIPVVETGIYYASGIYFRVKNSNRLFRWSFGTVEGGVFMVLDKSLTAAAILQSPISIVDDLVCKGLDKVEARVPAITYPPVLLMDKTKDYVSSTLIQPVLKRADSVKQIGIIEASKYGEMAATKFDSALDKADQYVDKYLPDATDGGDVKETEEGSKAVRAIKHANRFSRKLQRRLTRRTIAEAKALKQQSVDTMECLLYLSHLMLRDPKQFAEKMKSVWMNLSEDEPENQVPPANLEQLIGMFTRETARRVVHLTNFTISKTLLIPQITINIAGSALDTVNYCLDFILQTVHLEGSRQLVLNKSKEQLSQIYMFYSEILVLVTKFIEASLSDVSAQQKPRTFDFITIGGDYPKTPDTKEFGCEDHFHTPLNHPVPESNEMENQEVFLTPTSNPEPLRISESVVMETADEEVSTPNSVVLNDVANMFMSPEHKPHEE